MIKLKDKSKDIWSWSKLFDINIIQFEDGTEKELETSDVIMDFWDKYKGVALSEIDSEKDLNFILKVAVEREEGFAAHCVNMRLQELK